MSAGAAKPAHVTVIVPAWNSRRWIPGCLEALRNQSYSDFGVILVDSGSEDGSGGLVAERFPEVEVLRLERNRGFANAVDEGIDRAASPLVALLNVDTEVAPDWLENLVRSLEAADPQVAAVGSKMMQMDRPDLIDDAGDTLSWYGSAVKRGHGQPACAFDRAEEVFSVCAAAALYRADFLARERFDRAYGSYFEDLDLCLRGRLLGYRFLFEPRARALHWSGGAGLSRPRYVTLVTRNRLLTFAKSIPARLLLRHFRKLAWGQFYFLVAYHRPLASLRGYAGFLARLPHVLLERRRIRALRELPTKTIDALLETSLGEPPLRRLFARKLGLGSAEAFKAGVEG